MLGGVNREFVNHVQTRPRTLIYQRVSFLKKHFQQLNRQTKILKLKSEYLFPSSAQPWTVMNQTVNLRC